MAVKVCDVVVAVLDAMSVQLTPSVLYRYLVMAELLGLVQARVISWVATPLPTTKSAALPDQCRICHLVMVESLAASQVRSARPFRASAARPVGADGTAAGVPVTVAEAVPLPSAFTARTCTS